MLNLQNLQKTYFSDYLGKLYIDEEKINQEKSKLRKDISLEECKSILGRKYKVCLNRMLPILSFILVHKESQHIQLSTTYNYNQYIKHLYYSNNIPLLDTFKIELEANQRSNHRVIQDLLALNIIKCVSNKKHFNDKNRKNNISYSYIFNTSSIHSLLSLSNIFFKYHYNNIIPLLDTFEKEEEKETIKHSKLYNEYLPKLKYELERQKVEDDFKYYLKEGGARPYAYFCSSENKVSDERKGILNAYFGEDKWIEWDRSASIYNLTYSYNTGKYINNDVDLHSILNNNKKFKSEDERKMFKVLNMTKYFSDARKIRRLVENMIKCSEKITNLQPLTDKEFTFYKNNLERVQALIVLSKADSVDDVVDFYKSSKKALIDALGGKKIENDAIFIMEGAVNLATMNDLNEMGYKCVSVYDGFYTDCKDEELIEDIYKKNILKYITK